MARINEHKGEKTWRPKNWGKEAEVVVIGWSEDNIKELEREWIKKGDTIKTLAESIGGEMDTALLKTTIEKYNTCCANGNDPDNRNPISSGRNRPDLRLQGTHQI